MMSFTMYSVSEVRLINSKTELSRRTIHWSIFSKTTINSNHSVRVTWSPAALLSTDMSRSKVSTISRTRFPSALVEAPTWKKHSNLLAGVPGVFPSKSALQCPAEVLRSALSRLRDQPSISSPKLMFIGNSGTNSLLYTVIDPRLTLTSGSVLNIPEKEYIYGTFSRSCLEPTRIRLPWQELQGHAQRTAVRERE
jgi:hypothetical protein